MSDYERNIAQPLLPNPLAKAPRDILSQEISNPVQVLPTNKPPPPRTTKAVNEIFTGILFTETCRNSEPKQSEGEEIRLTQPRVSFSPNSELEIDS